MARGAETGGNPTWRQIMRKTLLLIACTLACSGTRQAGVQSPPSSSAVPAAVATSSGPPPWAYGFAAAAAPASGAPTAPAGGRGGAGGGAAGGGRGGAGGGAGGRGAAAPDTTRHRAQGSALSFTLAQVRDTYGPADWFPGDHGEMPAIVKNGRRDAQILACSLCHYPNGKGRPENAGVSGLPVQYFVQTMLDFKNDLRKSSDARKANTNRMIAFAKAMTDEEIRASAAYFGAIKWSPWIKVVEADAVPKTRIAAGMFIPLEGAEAGSEPIGQRIIEVPENTEQTETLRNSHSGFIAYVPRGSVARGEAISARAQCALCHGASLTGLGPVPGIAGRSPSYIVRQLYDFQSGARKGHWGELMKAAVAPMSADDMIAVAAFAASRNP
jgi:cytochrome c553